VDRSGRQRHVGILALQGDVGEHRSALAELGAAPRDVRRPDDLAGLDGIILPGGESTTMSMLLESSGLGEPLRKELEAGLPVFGTCAGMILLAADVVDGRPDQRQFRVIDISVRRNGYGRQIRSFECDLGVEGLGVEPLHAIFIRAPVVERVGPGVEVLADLPEDQSTTTAPTAAPADAIPTGANAVVCRQGPVLVSAFHPELTSDRRLHQLFLSIIDDCDR
jgi:pyridoxal 5'-phosphate synthase pdxT subunit